MQKDCATLLFCMILNNKNSFRMINKMVDRKTKCEILKIGVWQLYGIRSRNIRHCQFQQVNMGVSKQHQYSSRGRGA